MSLLDQFDCDRPTLERILSATLSGADDGELFVEATQSESLVFDDGKLKSASYDTRQGFGLRSVFGEASGYAHAGDLSRAALERAGQAVRAVGNGYSGELAEPPRATNTSLYEAANPLIEPSFETKARLLEEIDAYARGLGDDVHQVSVSLTGSWQNVAILRADGRLATDIRPLVRLSISAVCRNGDQQETGSHGIGGRHSFERIITPDVWKHAVDEAVRQARVNLEAVPAPAGTFDVVLGNGWPGVMLHEAVGHGLEGDFNRKGTSAFAGLMGEHVAAKGVTVVDDGTVSERRGSLTIDDEGTPTNRTTLIEDGVLVGYMQDRQNARLMGMEATGNGRRQSYAHAPMPRMTNTVMMGGDYTPEEIISSVKDGVYAVSFGGGQVDITSGKYVFGCTEAYRIRDGKVGEPLKGAMMIGNGPADMKRVRMLGNDMSLDTGIGMCGKQGQGVPVGVGQPHCRMDDITIGGTDAG
ncbi:metalloprotease TldD [Ahrensia sp. R2A130]|uniref:metalloprotease TldD n=1 Tax=Ahrensia sp. R2A130 TaxID=744979 RepID=UPI0001E0D85E|nr:metalloprotease TldD [Ahrensia sp. R2A130]EFL88878.1 protein TldD [Ahrensia sp. R2A130]